MSEGLRWLTNMENPQDPNHHAARHSDESGIAATERERRWLQGKVIGDPKPGTHTVEQLKAWGLVGIYVAKEAK